jgi:hypothetical protein
LTSRTAVRIALVTLAAATAVTAVGGPRLTWENTGLRVEHPPHQGAAALLGAAALAGAALSGRSRAIVALGLAAAAILGALGAHRLAWRVDAIEAGLHERTLAGWKRIAWRDVEVVEPRPDTFRLRARGGATIAVSMRGFAAEDRIRFERTVARRVREAAR